MDYVYAAFVIFASLSSIKAFLFMIRNPDLRIYIKVFISLLSAGAIILTIDYVFYTGCANSIIHATLCGSEVGLLVAICDYFK